MKATDQLKLMSVMNGVLSGRFGDEIRSLNRMEPNELRDALKSKIEDIRKLTVCLNTACGALETYSKRVFGSDPARLALDIIDQTMLEKRQ